MEPQTLTQIQSLLQVLNTGGVIATLVIGLYGGYRRWWVFGWQFVESERRVDAMRQERDEWKAIAMQSTRSVSSAVEIAKAVR